MSVITIPKALRDKLGDEGTDAFIKVISEAGLDTRRDLATKDDIAKVRDEIAIIRGELLLLKWMMGILIAGVVSLVMKAFFM
ncbi:hypothetical protein MBAV_000902 [Candidatus Magnetobacterium bavaricum]|uniref:Uncharacterized protein n=1 Tax=Candidatus Magnetobacterium bavaricum TaxID=29290 RepID=D7GXF7_9BACT|nr:hypothetical protein MBAV_000902 [Candidatus Magnetobacterium bavaricum]CBL42947.1 hypothetical protein mtbajb2F00038 [Candidatus Magnetobacterium bavaricum]